MAMSIGSIKTVSDGNHDLLPTYDECKSRLRERDPDIPGPTQTEIGPAKALTAN